MRIIAAAAVWLVVAAALAAAQGGSVSGFDRPLGRKTFGRGGSGLSACAPRPNEGPCRLSDYEEAFVVPAGIWGDAIEGSGCPRDAKAALTARLESAAAAFNAGVHMTRKALGDQTAAQEGVACVRSAGDETRYVGRQRLIFYTRWQDEVEAWLARCPPPGREPVKAKRGAARRAAMCRWLKYEDRVSGGCETMPVPPGVDEDHDSTMVHASVRSCPERTRTAAHAHAVARRANFKMAENFNQWAANQFLEALGGVRCDDAAAAYGDYAAIASRTFHDARLEVTAAAGAACRAGGN